VVAGSSARELFEKRVERFKRWELYPPTVVFTIKGSSGISPFSGEKISASTRQDYHGVLLISTETLWEK
jgi:hypothetical protein